jgi:hypothetical protein
MTLLLLLGFSLVNLLGIALAILLLRVVVQGAGDQLLLVVRVVGVLVGY